MKGLKIKLLMKIDWDQIDEFQDQAGNTAAYGRACDFMLAYISQIQKPLPGIAGEGIESRPEISATGQLAEGWGYTRPPPC